VGLLWLVRVNSTDTAGGSDAYGYVSEAVLLSQGHLSTSEQVLSRFGLPENSDVTHPLGYLPRGAATIVPSYPFGYPLLLAAAIRVGGLTSAYWLTAILAAGTVLFTYFLGRSQLGRLGGILASSFVLILPSFFYGVIQPMSDVPATCFAALALLALLGMGKGARSALVLGLAEGIDVWIRPNLVLLVIPTLAWLIWSRDRRLAWFCLMLAPFLVVEGLFNLRQYGAPWVTGYGEQVIPSVADALTRALRYLRRLQDQQAEIGLVLVGAGLALGRISWSRKLLLLAVATVFLGFFAFYPIDDHWSYARFLLPAFPAIAVLEAAGLTRLYHSVQYRPLAVAAVSVGLAVLAWFSVEFDRNNGVFALRAFEQRYQSAARLVTSHADRSALVLAMQHSGSARFYSGYPTMRYDLGPLTDLLATLREVQGHGGTVYLLVDPAEVETMRQSDRAVLLAGAQLVGRVVPNGPAAPGLYRVNVPPEPDNIPAEQQTRVTFGDEIALRGYDISTSSASPGADVMVTLYWQALRPPRYDYSVFIHVDDAAGHTVAQSDGYPVGGEFPTTHWSFGYAIVDVHHIHMPDAPASGPLRIIAGLYRLDTMERLWPADGHGPLPDNFVSLR
jgi:hypothetical protein